MNQSNIVPKNTKQTTNVLTKSPMPPFATPVMFHYLYLCSSVLLYTSPPPISLSLLHT